MGDGSGVVGALEGRRTRQGQRLAVQRLDGQRARQQLARFAHQRAAVFHAQRFGVVGEQPGVVAAQGQRALVGGHGLVGAALHHAHAAEHGPAGGVVALRLQAFGELVGHHRQLGGVGLAIAGMGLDALRRHGLRGQRRVVGHAGEGVAQRCHDQHRHDHHAHQARRGPGGFEIGQVTRHRALVLRHVAGTLSSGSASNSSAPRRVRRRSTQASSATPPISSANGPSQSSAVLLFSGGR